MGKDILIIPSPTPPTYPLGNPVIYYSGATSGAINTTVLADGTVSYEGDKGILFQVADSLYGTLFAVFNNTNQRIFEVTSSNIIVAGSPNTNAFTINDNVGVDVASGLTIPNVAMAPSATIAGLYYNVPDEQPYYSDGSSWSSPRGTSGSSGTSGTSGTSGSSGSSGTSGSSGMSGTYGRPSGSSGTDGTSGSSGSSGSSGTSSGAGSSGSSGTSATSGTSGSSGSSSGTSGSSGSSGSSGIDGSSGSSGTSGTSGSSGSSGNTGTSGSSGTAGSSGISGVGGTSGSSGTSGTDGTSGNSGTSGSSGVSGASGTSGISAIAGSTLSGSNHWIQFFDGAHSGNHNGVANIDYLNVNELVIYTGRTTVNPQSDSGNTAIQLFQNDIDKPFMFFNGTASATLAPPTNISVSAGGNAYLALPYDSQLGNGGWLFTQYMIKIAGKSGAGASVEAWIPLYKLDFS